MLQAFQTYRSLLFGIAYRMLGRVSEAEDIVQEVWLRWQKQDLAAIESPQGLAGRVDDTLVHRPAAVGAA
ncbi:MAG: sigma factor [Lacunisphaera sp.]